MILHHQHTSIKVHYQEEPTKNENVFLTFLLTFLTQVSSKFPNSRDSSITKRPDQAKGKDTFFAYVH